jgi:hypothetical protein
MTGLTFKQTCIAVLTVWLGFGSNAFSQAANSGRDAFDFLKISPISRAVGIGGAYTALGDDVGSIYYNPAGLASLLTSELNITYLSLYQSMNYESFSFAYPVGEALPSVGGTIAVGVNLLQPGSLSRTNDFGVTVNGNATFSSGDQVFTLAYARAFGPSLHMGFAVNMLQQQIDTISSSLFDVSVGMVVLPPFDGMRLGVSLQNIGAQASGFNLPFNLNGGISYRRYEIFSEQDDGALTAEVSLPFQPIEDPVGVKVGAEYNFKWVGSRITIRGGYEFLNTSLSGIGLALGAGYGLDLSGAVLFLDYAYAPADIFGISNRISLTTKF